MIYNMIKAITAIIREYLYRDEVTRDRHSRTCQNINQRKILPRIRLYSTTFITLLNPYISKLF